MMLLGSLNIQGSKFWIEFEVYISFWKYYFVLGKCLLLEKTTVLDKILYQ